MSSGCCRGRSAQGAGILKPRATPWVVMVLGMSPNGAESLSASIGQVAYRRTTSAPRRGLNYEVEPTQGVALGWRIVPRWGERQRQARQSPQRPRKYGHAP